VKWWKIDEFTGKVEDQEGWKVDECTGKVKDQNRKTGQP
jgi:hypothetical protein